jgi:hypothetical protein
MEKPCCYANMGNHPCDCAEIGQKAEEAEKLVSWFEHAPKTVGNPEIVGYWTEYGNYLCSNCAASIMARGCRIAIDTYDWKEDGCVPVGLCVCCESKNIKER